jgi:hypothetical protein
METARAKLTAESPPAFIMDMHRLLPSGNQTGPRVTRPDYGPETYPSPETVRRKFNNVLIWITEGDVRPFTRRDDFMPPEFEHYGKTGVELHQLFADPYHAGTPGTAVQLLPE